MSKQVTNADLMEVLGNIREDIGGLKTSSALFVKGLENHSERIGELEKGFAKQKGKASMLLLMGSLLGSAIGWLVTWFRH